MLMMLDVGKTKEDLHYSRSTVLFYAWANPPRLVLKRDDRNVGFVSFLLGELYSTIHESIKGVVLAHTDVAVGIVDSTPLTDDNIAGLYDLATKLLETQALALRLTTVLGT